MTGEDFISEHLILPQGIVPLCEDQNLRVAVRASLPTLYDGGLAVQQMGGDPNRGIWIPVASEGRSQPSSRAPVLHPMASKPWAAVVRITGCLTLEGEGVNRVAKSLSNLGLKLVA